MGGGTAFRLDDGASDLPSRHWRSLASHHGTHRTSRRHERAAVSPEEGAKMLETMLPGRIVIQKFSWRWYFDTARRCKLYDFDRLCWTDFKGRPTSTPLRVVVEAA